PLRARSEAAGRALPGPNGTAPRRRILFALINGLYLDEKGRGDPAFFVAGGSPRVLPRSRPNMSHACICVRIESSRTYCTRNGFSKLGVLSASIQDCRI